MTTEREYKLDERTAIMAERMHTHELRAMATALLSELRERLTPEEYRRFTQREIPR